jgi:hypothetical protein
MTSFSNKSGKILELGYPITFSKAVFKIRSALSFMKINLSLASTARMPQLILLKIASKCPVISHHPF